MKMVSKCFIFIALLGLVSASVDLKSSITRIGAQIAKTNEKPANWGALPAIIGGAIPCLSLLSPGGLFQVEGDGLPKLFTEYIEKLTPLSIANDLLQVNWNKVTAKKSNDETFMDDLKAFMNTTNFTTIHNHIWGDIEFIDLMGYIKDANYEDIYETIKQFYTDMGRADLAGEIPPTTNPTRTVQRVGNLPKPSANAFPKIIMKSSPFKQETTADCDLLGLLATINGSNIHEIIKVLLYIVQEVLGNAAMHILMMKLGEPQKGLFIHDTLALPEMESVFPLVQRFVLYDNSIGQLNEILRQVTGLNLYNIGLFKYIVNLIEFLVWNIPFPTA